jgi:mRNA-degrading endonuclease YafQ of YafQ-DinJ toxin-antitoxin module
MNIVPSKRFVADAGKLEKRNARLKKALRKTIHLLHENPTHPSLRLHKLIGENIYSISVTMSIRIIISRRGDDIHLLRIGTHEEVY